MVGNLHLYSLKSLCIYVSFCYCLPEFYYITYRSNAFHIKSQLLT